MKYEKMNDEELEQAGVSDSKSMIVNAALFIEALKSSGYKSTHNAVAEIVDNSIDAEAENIFVIGEQGIENNEKRIVSFAFLDDGKGMDYQTLKNCLTIGFTTNHGKKGIGRFGVGLPQASIFVCNRVEVYSWQNGIENCQMVHLDVDEIKEFNLNEISDPIKTDIPNQYARFIKWNGFDKKYDFSKSGTLVVWTNCTNVDNKLWKTCVNYMSRDLGRKYRYFLSEKSKTIKLIELFSLNEENVLPNDPLYLMAPSQECVPGNIDSFIADGYQSKQYNEGTGYTEPLFEPYIGENDDDKNCSKEIDLPIVYEENGKNKQGNVIIKYSVVKRKYYSPAELKLDKAKKPGSLPYGSSQRIKENVGISIVRNKREIDFGSFGFFDIYNVPEYRWWGIEISFDSSMDSAFGISNNKQSVNLKPMSKEEMAEDNGTTKTLWHQLADEIIPTIKEMTARNSALRGEEMPKQDNTTPPPSSTISNQADILSGDDSPTNESDLTEEEKTKEAREYLVNNEGEADPTDAEIKQFIDSKVRVKVVYNKNKYDSFISTSYAAGTLTITINARHAFYEEFVKKVYEDDDQKLPFELMLIALFKTVKSLTESYPEAMDLLVHQLNAKLTNYMLEMKKQNGDL